jgi:hypothetical protein
MDGPDDPQDVEERRARREVITWKITINFPENNSEAARDYAAGRLAVLVAMLKTEFDVEDVIIDTEEAQ